MFDNFDRVGRRGQTTQTSTDNSIGAPDVELLKQQESTLIVLNLIVLAVLALFHLGFVSLLGRPSRVMLGAVAVRFFTQILELAWLKRSEPDARRLGFYSRASVVVNVAFASLVSMLASHEDSHYSVLMVIPIVSAAFRLSLSWTLLLVVLATGLTFVQVWNYFRLHPPAQLTEYFEAATTGLTFLVIAVIAWVLGNSLRRDRRSLQKSLDELRRTRDRLIAQEKLAAVGRLSGAIAHEIRNPVAMIASSLALAKQDTLDPRDRAEMFRIAATESARLERLTSDFLTYAGSKPLERAESALSLTVDYVASLTRTYANGRPVHVEANCPVMLSADIDAFQVRQALLNVALNAVDATRDGGFVRIGAVSSGRNAVILWVENEGDRIPDEAVERILEPFFTTKPDGTGLGLAIAASIANAHGGELALARNEPGCVRFELRLPSSGGADGSSTDRR